MNSKVILYVEDEEDDVFLMTRAFDKNARPGFHLMTVSDGQQMIDYLSGVGRFADRAAFPLPTMILLDLNLPVKSGFEVLEWIRANAGFVCLPVVIFSSSNHASDQRRAYRTGANSYLVKPSTSAELEVVVRGIQDYWLTLNCSRLN